MVAYGTLQHCDALVTERLPGGSVLAVVADIGY